MPGDIEMMRGFFDQSHADHSTNGLINIVHMKEPENNVNRLKIKYKELYDKYFINGVPREDIKDED